MAFEDQNDIQLETPTETARKNKFAQGEYKLDMYDWLWDTPQVHNRKKLVEVRFKSTHKDIFENVNDLPLEVGDVVAVEASPGHDIGIVSLKGELVYQQIKKNRIPVPNEGFKKIYRVARPSDIDKWNEARNMEHPTMIKARIISKKLRLNMKIGDVEFQGDKTKAIFYYIADERVDFRELIKVLAEEFKIRVEMRQIGARQEAGRIGGIGPCGKAICCSQFVGRFVSVSTQAARYQELSLNPQKLAGQCGKLKCCLNYEVDSYIDAQKDFPNTSIPLVFGGGIKAIHQKTDVYKRILWYSYEKERSFQFVALSVEKVKEIIALNKAGKELDKLESDQVFEEDDDEPDYENVVGQESLTRFDNKSKRKKKKSGSSTSNASVQDRQPRSENRPQLNKTPHARAEGQTPQNEEQSLATPQQQRRDNPVKKEIKPRIEGQRIDNNATNDPKTSADSPQRTENKARGDNQSRNDNRNRNQNRNSAQPNQGEASPAAADNNSNYNRNDNRNNNNRNRHPRDNNRGQNIANDSTADPENTLGDGNRNSNNRDRRNNNNRNNDRNRGPRNPNQQAGSDSEPANNQD